MNVPDYQDFDRSFWDEELADFVPDTVYDMHVHMWSERHRGSCPGPHRAPAGDRLPGPPRLGGAAVSGPQDALPGTWHADPRRIDTEGHNDWMAEEMKQDPESAINMMVTPDMTPEYVAAQVKRHGFLGLKPYRTFAPDPTHCRIRDFLPESFIEVAHDLGLAITMHMSKPEGPADADNQRDLADYTKRYPRAQWILAHCARAFNCFMMERAIHFLTDLPNIWYDTSAVNDLYSQYLLMKHEDRSRVMFGSDNVVAGCARGKYVTYGRRGPTTRARRKQRPTAIPGRRWSSTSSCGRRNRWRTCWG